MYLLQVIASHDVVFSLPSPLMSASRPLLQRLESASTVSTVSACQPALLAAEDELDSFNASLALEHARESQAQPAAAGPSQRTYFRFVHGSPSQLIMPFRSKLASTDFIIDVLSVCESSRGVDIAKPFQNTLHVGTWFSSGDAILSQFLSCLQIHRTSRHYHFSACSSLWPATHPLASIAATLMERLAVAGAFEDEQDSDML